MWYQDTQVSKTLYVCLSAGTKCQWDLWGDSIHAIHDERNKIQSSFTSVSVYEISRYTTRQLLPSSEAVGLKRLQARIVLENRFRSCSFTGQPSLSLSLSLNSLRGIPSRRAKEIRLAGRGGAFKSVNHKNTRDYKGADDYHRQGGASRMFHLVAPYLSQAHVLRGSKIVYGG